MEACVVAHAFSPTTWEIAVGGSTVQSHCQLSAEFEASLCCMRLLRKREGWEGHTGSGKPAYLHICTFKE